MWQGVSRCRPLGRFPVYLSVGCVLSAGEIGGGIPKHGFWVLIFSIHRAESMGSSVWISQIDSRCVTGWSSFMGHWLCPLGRFPIYLSVCCVLSTVGIGGGIPKHGFWVLIVSIHRAVCMGFVCVDFSD